MLAGWMICDIGTHRTFLGGNLQHAERSFVSGLADDDSRVFGDEDEKDAPKLFRIRMVHDLVGRSNVFRRAFGKRGGRLASVARPLA
jgi:hypothetical protein